MMGFGGDSTFFVSDGDVLHGLRGAARRLTNDKGPFSHSFSAKSEGSGAWNIISVL